LLNGKEFDSSIKRGEAATFPLSQVIEGWQIGIPLMSVGSKYRFFIPAALAYKSQGAGTMIEPGAALIFEVELLKIN
jgi:FKBP-type peptidyl-prolyl cis-trans isomerase